MGIYGVTRPPDDDQSRRARMTRSMFELVDNFESIPYYVIFLTELWDNLPDHLAGSAVYPAVHNFMLAARSFGSGTVPTMWFMECEDELRALLEIPEMWHIAALMPLGYPKGSHGPLHRRPIEELVHWNRFGDQRPAPDGARASRRDRKGLDDDRRGTIVSGYRTRFLAPYTLIDERARPSRRGRARERRVPA